MKRLRADEAGVAMIMVVGMAGVMFTFIVLIAVRSVNDLGQVRSERLFEQTLHVADSGIDHTLFRLREDRNFNSGDGALPDFSAQADPEEAEKDWALAAANNNALVTESDGQWQVVKPVGTRVIYAVGYVPTKADADKIRIIRAEYDFPPLLPRGALLTGGSLSINGGVTLSGANGSAHANGDGIVIGGSNQLSGQYTTSGDFESNGSLNVCQPPGEVPDCDPSLPNAGQPEQEVPDINPRDSYYMSQYDLCPDGSVRAGPNYASTGGAAVALIPAADDVPCTGSELTFNNGWVHSGIRWRYNSATNYDGVYYVYQGAADIQGGGSLADPWEVTVFAEPVTTGSGAEEDCSHSHDLGDISVSGNPKLVSYPGSPLLLIAGRDLSLFGSAGAGGQLLEGVLAAHEQYDIGGNVGIVGTAISNDLCDTTGSPESLNSVGGSVTIDFDTYDIPLGKRIRTTLWLEL